MEVLQGYYENEYHTRIQKHFWQGSECFQILLALQFLKLRVAQNAIGCPNQALIYLFYDFP